MNAKKTVSITLLFILLVMITACGMDTAFPFFTQIPTRTPTPMPQGDQLMPPQEIETQEIETQETETQVVETETIEMQATEMDVLDDMRYYQLSDRDAETRAAMSVVNAALRADQRPYQTQTAYPRFRVGNMAFIQIRTTPTAGVRDLGGSSRYVVVVLGAEPQRVGTPNAELFARFMSVVRADPDIMEQRHRIRTALILATGDDDYIGSDGALPTWTDEDGVLVISYYNYVRQMSDMVRPSVAASTLTVDENQNFIIESYDVGYDVPRNSE